ncbi:amidase, hydantoinase carbamoylase family [Secundilactobacillus odoratitofui DSM 19909 = JCM 15043]|uniref:Amidase, hydantoinase carbamoylase family n=1 Tax=Secundilactobacillus odoratitofui DSM 19909 = JCM 15043 TaxID=1423776 RepID=A0A0R1LYX0_9LACO|nr:M20 family metallo-hydrolase [Secundilactobacillus odoratitofui]KRK98153.1 amidase, hydantoinase carbamoylase family [Secundilactobacillus odoratitofui DSM 19909 = JCM 15043]
MTHLDVSNQFQFWRWLNQINARSTQPDRPGQTRLVYSPSWFAAQQALIDFGTAADLVTCVDDIGNVYLDYPGTDNQVIATGSHMDTVVNGGQFDGLYGILGGLQAIMNLKQRFGRPRHTLRLIAFSEEEGSRFNATFTGSKYYVRQEMPPTILTDINRIDFSTARQQAVKQLLKLPEVQHFQPNLPTSFTELHIEQGPRLMTQHATIGLVCGIVGQRRYSVDVIGATNHAGTTPMHLRHDALQSAITLITKLRLAAKALDSELTFTVGQLSVSPNVANVIPGRVTFSIDIRHDQSSILTQFEQQLHTLITERPDKAIKCHVQQWVNDLPVKLDARLLTMNRQITQDLGYPTTTLVSGAGHDSYILSQAVPTTMLFVPSVGGISHAPNEQTNPADLAAGIDVLTESLRRQAY